MKFLIFLILSISSIILLNTYGQAGNPPANVTKSFTQKFPAAQSIKWFKETQRTISMLEVPESVKTGLINSKFSTWKLNAVYVLFFPGMITQYRLVVTNGNDTVNLLFGWDGKLLDDEF